jgi:hypothetical protein
MQPDTVWVDTAIFQRISEALGDAFNTQPLEPSSRIDDGDIVVLQGKDAARDMAVSQAGLCVMAIVKPEQASEVDPIVGDFICEPWTATELAGRLRQLTHRTQTAVHAELLSRAVEYAGDIIEIGTSGAVLQYVNPSYTRILGFTREQVIGKTPAQLVRSDAHSPEYFRNIDQTLKAGKVWSGLLISRNVAGQLVHLESTISPVSNSRGTVTHHVAVKRDVTERIQREKALEETNAALRKARDAAVLANKTKSEFLANMSHELRTPLNAVIGYSELLIEDAEDVEPKNTSLINDLQKIHGAGSHLLSLINDVLDMSKIESGRMELDLQDLELEPLLNSIKTTVEPIALRDQNYIVVETKDLPATMRTDPQKLKQILMNLMSNACKFTKGGLVHLGAYGEPGGWVRLQVRDEGIGMTPEQRNKIFKPFVQADSSTTRRYGGTGLGLAISLRFCEILGGRIEVESEPGKGSTFEVWLPMTARPPSIPPGLAPAPGEATVLVIDDDQLTYDTLNRALSERGFQVEWAATGADGVNAAKRHQPHVIVLDVVMPGMDGWEVLTSLKADPETESIPVIMVTLLEESNVGVSLGAVDYLVKPIKAPRLLAAIQKWLGRPRDQVNILVVEDDAALREIAERTLGGTGYKVATAENGAQALQAIASLPPDLIVLDLMMPEMDGFEFLQLLRQKPEFRHTPVIVATAKELTEQEHALLQRSTQRVIQKSAHSRTELLYRVEKQVCAILRSPRPSTAPPAHGPSDTD